MGCGVLLEWQCGWVYILIQKASDRWSFCINKWKGENVTIIL